MSTEYFPLLTDRARFAHVPLKAGTYDLPLLTDRARFAHVPLKAEHDLPLLTDRARFAHVPLKAGTRSPPVNGFSAKRIERVSRTFR